MFTGIVQAQATVTALEPRPFGLRLRLDRGGWQPRYTRAVALGDSVCVSGVCLTVSELTDQAMTFDVIVETLTKTTLGNLAVGAMVNLEAAVTADQPLGGHFMQGHVDAVGRVSAVKRSDEEYRLTIAPPTDLLDYITPQGSVALDGVSLTIARVDENDFEVALIPTTLELTTLGGLEVDGRVNLETDVLAKTVVHYLQRHAATNASAQPQGVNWRTLRQAGFIDDEKT